MQLQRTLGLGGGIALAIGSVAGSGILFLPSVIYRLAQHDALVVWALATLLCVPLLLVFGEMVRESHDGSGIEGFIARGLGPGFASCIPLLFALIFPPALAAATLVAGGYLEAADGRRVARAARGRAGRDRGRAADEPASALGPARGCSRSRRSRCSARPCCWWC